MLFDEPLGLEDRFWGTAAETRDGGRMWPGL